MFGSGWRSTNHVVPFQNSLLAAHKGVRKGTLIDDYERPEENDIRRRFLSDEDAAFTLLFFLSKMATDFSPCSLPLGCRFCLRDTTTKEF